MRRHESRYVIGCTLVAALGGLLFGFDTAVISGTTRDLVSVFALSPAALGFTVSIALWGTVLGSLIVGLPGETYGRRFVLKVLAILYGVSAIGCALAPSWWIFLVSRFVGGIAIGGSSVMSPMYIAEIAPARLRGRLVAVSQFNIVSGILLAYLSNYLIAWGFESQAWRLMLGIQIVPSAIFFGLLYFIPESPRWLAKQGRFDEARGVLARVGEAEVDTHIQGIRDSLEIHTADAGESLFSWTYRLPILYAVLLAVFNQLSGINVIIYYAPTIFEMTGLGRSAALLQSVGIGLTNLLLTVVAMTMIDRFGRKTLMLVGSVGMTVFLALVAVAFYTRQFGGYNVLICLVGYIAFFAFSQGAVIWVFLSEIFPNKVRATGQALGSFTHWIMNALIAQTFPIVAADDGPGRGHPFAFFSVMMVLCFVFVWRLMPETKGRSLEQIQRDLGIV
jgi:SP family xylose:H+ symportor-like MFS transporter